MKKKILVLGDLHAGEKDGSLLMMEHQLKILSEVIEYIQEKAQDYLSNKDYDLIYLSGVMQYLTDSDITAMIKNIKKLLPNIPVLANGGINTPADAKNILKKTNADGIGIARGAWGNPWIFSGLEKPDLKQIKKTAIQHTKYFLKYNNNLITLRKHLLYYFKGQKNASELRQKIINIKNLDELKNI